MNYSNINENSNKFEIIFTTNIFILAELISSPGTQNVLYTDAQLLGQLGPNPKNDISRYDF